MMTGPAGVWSHWPQSELTGMGLKFCFCWYINGELMAWDSPAMLSYSRNEWVHREIRLCRGGSPPPPFRPDLITCSLILFLFSHKHDTKPEVLLFTDHRGRLALSWMGWIRYVLPACLPALRLSHSEALQQGTNMATGASGTAWPRHCIYK